MTAMCEACTDRAAIVYEDVTLPNGDRLALAIDSDGETSLWIARPLCAEHQRSAIHGNLTRAGHERLGPLNTWWQSRVDRLTTTRCGRPRADGQPCRAVVGRPGDGCAHHRRKRARP